jgi:spore germination cell wall hydrolase CwlJ-like protein
MPLFSLAQIIQAEAPTSSPEGQFAVASTIYNRAELGTFPGGTIRWPSPMRLDNSQGTY